jgi:hypothetical protein
VSVKAKEWLLDPSDIIISNASTNSNVTGAPSNIEPTSGSASSTVTVATIQNAIDDGTSVIITTTNTGTQGSGVGNITVVDALNLVNNSTDNSPATLSLIADNGIFVNANITGSGAGLVNIDLLAKGNAANATDSSGIVVNNNIAINTNGTIKLDGTNKNTNVNSRGITFNSGSSIKAASFDIKGTATSITTGSHGVHMAGNNRFTSNSAAVTSQINGISNSNGFIPGNTSPSPFNGITAATNINGNVTFDAGNGSMVVKGSNANSQLGVRVSEAGGATAITTKGEVTLGALEANSGFSMRTGSITAQTGNLTIRGQATGAVKGVSIIGDSTLKTDTADKNIDIVGRADTTSAGQSAIGVDIGRFPNGPKFDSKGSINIEGTVTGSGTGSGVAFSESGWGQQTSVMTARRDITIRGNNRASDTNTAHAVSLIAGLDATAGGKITLQAETNNVNANAIQMSSRTALLNGTVTALAGNTTLKANGDVLIQANQGGIIMNSSPLVTNPKLISGNNITIDNTGAGMTVNGVANANGGSIDANGTITAGTGKATNVGVLVADSRAITATGNLNITGASASGVGIDTNGVLTATNNVNLTGRSSGTNANAHGVLLKGNVKSNDGSVNITGTSTASNGGAGAIIQAKVDAKNNITLDGRSGNTTNVQGLVIQESVTSVDGDITVTGETKAGTPGQRAVAITANGAANGSLKVKDGQFININANTLFINPASSVDAGSGTVNIKTLTAGNAIVIGGPSANDVMNADLTKQTLGIDQTELNRITAGNLVIGDTASSGRITVSGATDLSKFETVRLQTSSEGSIGDNFVTTSVLTAKNLELLSGSVRMEVDHQVDTLAAIVKDRIEFQNAKALSIGKVNNTVGITTTEKLGAEDNRIAVLIETYGGDLTVKESVTTANDKTFSVVLAAGSNDNRRETSSGNVIIENGSQITTGEGGQAVIFTGSIAGSTGVTTLAGGMGSGRYRYDTSANDTEDNFTKALDASGVSVIYREQPEIKVAINDQNKTFDNIPFSGGTGNVVEGQLVNGDTLQNALTFGGNSQGAVAVGSYAIEGSAGDPSALGYKVTFEKPSAVLTIAAAPTPTPAPTPDPTPNPDPTPDNVVPYIPPINPDAGASTLSGRGTATLVAAGDGFRLAGAEEGQCTPDNLEFCDCEEAKDDKGLNLLGVQLCFEPKETPKQAL